MDPYVNPDYETNLKYTPSLAAYSSQPEISNKNHKRANSEMKISTTLVNGKYITESQKLLGMKLDSGNTALPRQTCYRTFVDDQLLEAKSSVDNISQADAFF